MYGLKVPTTAGVKGEVGGCKGVDGVVLHFFSSRRRPFYIYITKWTMFDRKTFR
jgi:hypothetical protein